MARHTDAYRRWRVFRAWELLAAVAVYASYRVRPYDMLADRRRWFWQPRTRCAGVLVLPARYDQDTSTTEG